MKRILFVLALLSTIPGIHWAEVAATFENFRYPTNITIDGKQMVISDYPSIHILSLKDYKILKTFGREGSGPGEFWLEKALVDRKERGLPVRVGPDYILVNSFLWFSYFTKEGNLIKTLRLKNIYHGDRFWPLEKNFAAITGVREGNRSYLTLALFDEKSVVGVR